MTAMNGGSGGRDPNAILNECRDIDKGIDSIERNLERLRFLQQRAIDDTDASQNTQTNRELDALSSETMTLYRNFGHRLKTIKGMKESGDPRNSPQVGRVDRKLKAAINEYQQVDRDFRQKLSAQMERQYRIVRPDASDAEVREAVEDTSNNQVFSQAVCSPQHPPSPPAVILLTSSTAHAIQPPRASPIRPPRRPRPPRSHPEDRTADDRARAAFPRCRRRHRGAGGAGTGDRGEGRRDAQEHPEREQKPRWCDQQGEINQTQEVDPL